MEERAAIGERDELGEGIWSLWPSYECRVPDLLAQSAPRAGRPCREMAEHFKREVSNAERLIFARTGGCWSMA